MIVLADRENDPISDAVAMDVLARVRSMAASAGRGAPVVVAECVDDRCRDRMIAAGAAAAVRPLRSYPELLARALVAPGAERLLEDLFSTEGNELFRVDLAQEWRGRWSALVMPLLERGLGTAIAYLSSDRQVVLNPRGPDVVNVIAVFVILSDGQKAALGELATVLAKP